MDTTAKSSRIFLLLLSASLYLGNAAMAAGPQTEFVPAFPKLKFDRPLDLQHPKDGTGRLFVVEQGARIKVFRNDPKVSKAGVFLDIRDRVDVDEAEQGLLGLAFDPDYKKNGYFYVNYNAAKPLRTVISRFKVNPKDPNKADKKSEKVLLEFEQPYSNHNGGQVSFGPDGFLYIAVGDGGSRGDPHNNAQNLNSVLGKILRLDVHAAGKDRAYQIPSDNPFIGNVSGWREEIYAYGLRNPWRFSWDKAGTLWVADVGQDKIEEIDQVKNGGNYGWSILEGSSCFKPDLDCYREGLIEKPIAEYTHEEGRSVTGGFVYRGKRVPSLSGKYIFADFVAGTVWTLEDKAGIFDRQVLIKTSLNISSFGEDAAGELYACAFDGKIYHLNSR